MRPSWKALALLVVLVLSGCRPRDPLEWKVYAATPEEYDDWTDTTLKHAPEDIRQEFARSFLYLRGDSGLAGNPRSMFETRNRLCLRIHRKTIRQVILDGYHVEKVFLRNRILLESDNLLSNLKRSEALDAQAERSKRSGLDRMRQQQEASIELLKQRLKVIEDRVSALSPPAR